MKEGIVFSFFLVASMSFGFSQAMTDIKNLPIYEFRSQAEAAFHVLYVSGDGGMNNFSKALCNEFRSNGHSVMALDSKKYFWKAKTPQQFCSDLVEIINYSLKQWGNKPIIVIGYSFGADAAAFIPSHSVGVLKNVKSIVLLAPSSSTDFEVKLTDMVGSKSSVVRKYNVIEELNQITATNVLCIFPKNESGSIEKKVVNQHLSIESLPGDHWFNNDVMLLFDRILNFMLKV